MSLNLNDKRFEILEGILSIAELIIKTMSVILQLFGKHVPNLMFYLIKIYMFKNINLEINKSLLYLEPYQKVA
jgi:hypothetical protein